MKMDGNFLVRNKHMLVASGLIALYFLPLIKLGQDAYVLIQDNLDVSLVNMNF